MNVWTWVGYAAAACTSLAVLPQVVQAWRTRSVLGLSRRTYWIYLGSILLWLAYGLLRQEMPIVVANGTALVLTVAMLVAAYRFGSRWGGRRIRPADAAPTELPDHHFTRR